MTLIEATAKNLYSAHPAAARIVETCHRLQINFAVREAVIEMPGQLNELLNTLGVHRLQPPALKATHTLLQTPKGTWEQAVDHYHGITTRKNYDRRSVESFLTRNLEQLLALREWRVGHVGAIPDRLERQQRAIAVRHMVTAFPEFLAGLTPVEQRAVQLYYVSDPLQVVNFTQVATEVGIGRTHQQQSKERVDRYVDNFLVVKGVDLSEFLPQAPVDLEDHIYARLNGILVRQRADSSPQSALVREQITVSRAQAGDHDAFKSLFDAYQAPIYNYIYRLIGDAEDAFDMTQDTFLKAFLALPKTSDDLRVGAWLYRIATNVCLDELRHRKLVKWQPWEAFISVFHPSQIARDNPERDSINLENQEEVQLILSKLHPKYRMCLILREYHDLSYDEIADILSTTRAAVKSLLFRAREEFRQVYAKVERKPARASA